MPQATRPVDFVPTSGHCLDHLGDGGVRVSSVPSKSVTRLLAEWEAGDHEALRAALPLVYDELRRLAHHYMRQESLANFKCVTYSMAACARQAIR